MGGGTSDFIPSAVRSHRKATRGDNSLSDTARSRGKGRVLEGRATREETLLSSETSVPGTSRMGSTILGLAL